MDRAEDLLSCVLRFCYYDEQRFGKLNRSPAGLSEPNCRPNFIGRTRLHCSILRSALSIGPDRAKRVRAIDTVIGQAAFHSEALTLRKCWIFCLQSIYFRAKFR